MNVDEIVERWTERLDAGPAVEEAVRRRIRGAVIEALETLRRVLRERSWDSQTLHEELDGLDAAQLLIRSALAEVTP